MANIVEGIFSASNEDLDKILSEMVGVPKAIIEEELYKIKTRIEEVASTIPSKGNTGPQGERGLDGRDGKQGKNGLNGVDGRNGLDGKTGKDGVDGVDGKDGISITNAYVEFDGNLVIELSDGTQIDAGNVVGGEGGVSNIMQNYISNGASGSLIFKGLWDASTNTPLLTTTNVDVGSYYVVNVAGSTSLSGITDWQVNDWAVWNGTVWQKIDNSDLFTGTFAAGSAAAPSITTTGDTNTGIFFPAADTIAFTEGGSEAMRINSSGNVGIGTNNPSNRLTVQGNTKLVGDLNLEQPSIGETIGINLRTFDVGQSTTFSIFSDGVEGAITYNNSLAGSSNLLIGADNNFIYMQENSNIGFYTTNLERMRVHESGGVSIGNTTNPGATNLSVTGTTRTSGVTTPSVTATTTDLTLSAISTGAVKFNTAGGLQAQINDATTAGQYTLLARGTGNTQKITAFGTANLALQSTGGGTIDLRTGDETNTQLKIGHTASAVNFVQVTGAATGSGVTLSAQGSDANIALNFASKVAQNINFRTGASSLAQFTVVHTGTTVVNQTTATGSATGVAPTFGVQGSDTDIDLALTPKGAGRVRFGTYTGTILTPTGFIEIKDSGGTTRRLLVG